MIMGAHRKLILVVELLWTEWQKLADEESLISGPVGDSDELLSVDCRRPVPPKNERITESFFFGSWARGCHDR